MKETEFVVDIEHLEGYDFNVDFNKDRIEDIIMSEPSPLGSGENPHAGHLLAAAIGHCMCASMLFCLERARVDTSSLKARVKVKVERNGEGRLRLTRMSVILTPEVDDLPGAERCGELFEDYCIITQSIKEGMEIQVEVSPSLR